MKKLQLRRVREPLPKQLLIAGGMGNMGGYGIKVRYGMYASAEGFVRMGWFMIVQASDGLHRG